MKISHLEHELLLAYVLKKPREWIVAHPDVVLSPDQQRQLDVLIERRCNHEPIAYITNEKEFYGRKFYVDERVLIPRPATETLIDEVKKVYLGLKPSVVKGGCSYPSLKAGVTTHEAPVITQADTDIVIFTDIFKDKPITNNQSSINDQIPIFNDRLMIVDVGTGSGCIGITLALEIPNIQIICTDISESALEVAKKNAKQYNIENRIKFVCSDLLETGHCPLPTAHFIAVSNPPYIPTTESLPPDVANFEPQNALFAGPDGMDVLTELYNQCETHPKCIGCILEMQQEQHKKLTP